MKTMNDYTSICTKEQAIKAQKLGAPLVKASCEHYFAEQLVSFESNDTYYLIPTTQQMINWLRDKGIEITIDCATSNLHFIVWDKNENIIIQDVRGTDYKLVELGAIDGILNYLEG